MSFPRLCVRPQCPSILPQSDSMDYALFVWNARKCRVRFDSSSGREGFNVTYCCYQIWKCQTMKYNSIITYCIGWTSQTLNKQNGGCIPANRIVDTRHDWQQGDDPYISSNRCSLWQQVCSQPHAVPSPRQLTLPVANLFCHHARHMIC